MSNQFKNEKDLYNYLIPALNTKKNELHNYGYTFIKCNDIYNYFKNNIWVSNNELSIYDIINDILHTDNLSITESILKTISKEN